MGYNIVCSKDTMQKITIPHQCPVCEYPLATVNMQLFCRNTACSAQLNKRLEHFAKTLAIKGLGPATLAKLNLADITEIFYLDRDDIVGMLGSKTADKLLDEIERAKLADLATVITSFAIPLVGATASSKIASVVSSIQDINAEKCKEAGLGEKVTANLLAWLEVEYQELKEFLPFDFKPRKQPTANPNAKRVCITGKLKTFKTKAEAECLLSAAGFINVDSVTKTTDYLVDEGDKTSTKRAKAVSYGITIITDLNDLLLKENT